MKLKVLLFPALLSLAATLVSAQDTAPAAPAAPVAAAPLPETPPAAEPSPTEPAKKAGIKKRIPLDPPATALVKSEAVNVRGQPAFSGEVLGHLKKGATVTVVADIALRHPKKGEPGEWAEIAVPADVAVWVNSRFIDAEAKTVKAHRINLRAGPGENYSIVGRLEKGTVVTEIRNENGWIAIQPPTNAYAFVAAGFLDIQPAAVATPAPAPAEVVQVPLPATPAPASPQPVAPVPAPASTEPAPAAPAPTAQSEAEQELAALRQATVAQTTQAAAPASDAAAANAASSQNGVTPRVVKREGYVHRSYNVHSPAPYELHDIQTDRLIEYLQPADNMNFRTYIGTRISVTGPELIDPHWPRTPVLQVQSVGLIP